MNATQFRSTLAELRLTQVEAATLLGVDGRTVRRWIEANEVSGPADRALRAWVTLNRIGLAWRPDGRAIAENSENQLAKYRQHAIDLVTVVEKVKNRGGPRLPWTVDLDRCLAKAGEMEVYFYKLANGSFSPQSYSRPGHPDPIRDQPLLEDAYACIAERLAQTSDGKLEFMVLPGISGSAVRLMAYTSDPQIVAIVSCDAIRSVTKAAKDLTDEDCRTLLVCSELNRGLVSGLALNEYTRGKFAVGNAGMPVVQIGRKELLPIAKELDPTVVDRPGARWGTAW